ncbi:MAG TPA: hypothetical protein DEQ09_06135 [Bacteroidales bacterium]|nr:hypothetical protein [Bacteroidales bacterium]
MNRYFEIFFWLLVSIILIIAFGSSSGKYIHAFYFVSFLMPIIIGTSWFINSILVPTYLLKKKYPQFFIYLVYTVIISLSLLAVLVFAAFILLAYYEYENMWSIMTNYRLMPLIMYIVVLIYGFISMVKQYFNLQSLSESGSKEKGEFIVVRSERKNRRIECRSILYVESMADYVRIFMENGERIITRTNISFLDSELGDKHLRIHRSYLVNIDKIDSYSKERIVLLDKVLPISRTYKEKVMKILGE